MANKYINKSKSKIVAGIDLGSSKITTLVAQVSTDPVSFESSINIVGEASTASRGIKKGQIVNLEEAIEGTIASVEAAERMAGYNLSSAFISLGGAHIASQNSRGVVAVSGSDGEISSEDINRVIEAASAISLPSSRDLIHVLPREFVVDGESGVRDPVGMSGVRLEIETHLITAAQAAVKNLQKVVNEVGVTIDELVYSALASSQATLTDTEKELGCVLVDIGGGTTSVAVYVDSSLASSFVIPIGSKNVTNDLAIGLRVSLESAEKIKIALSGSGKKFKKDQVGEADNMDLSSLGAPESKKVSRRTLIEGIIKPRLNEIFTMVKIQLDREKLYGRVPAGAIITGGGSEVIGTIEAAKRTLAMPVRVGIPQGVSGLIDDIMSPAYATAVGLILYGIKNEPKEHLTSLSKRLKLPTKGVLGKLLNMIRDLLP